MPTFSSTTQTIPIMYNTTYYLYPDNVTTTKTTTSNDTIVYYGGQKNKTYLESLMFLLIMLILLICLSLITIFCCVKNKSNKINNSHGIIISEQDPMKNTSNKSVQTINFNNKFNLKHNMCANQSTDEEELEVELSNDNFLYRNTIRHKNPLYIPSLSTSSFEENNFYDEIENPTCHRSPTPHPLKFYRNPPLDCDIIIPSVSPPRLCNNGVYQPVEATPKFNKKTLN